MQVRQRRRRHGREGVHRGAELAQRRYERGTLARRSREHGFDDDEAVTAQRLGDVRERREVQDSAEGGDRVGNVLDPLAPGIQHLACALDRPEHRAGVEVGGLEELELERGDDPEVPAAAAHGPEEVGLVVAVGPDETRRRP